MSSPRWPAITRFFFYGTLIAGRDNPAARLVEARLTPLGPATTRGRLYAIPDPLGWYPALLPGDGAVAGQLYEAAADCDLAALDAYEDFDPANRAASLYLRREIAAGGGTAQAYLFNQPLPAGAVPIAGGDFAAWLIATGGVAFRGEAD